MDISAAFIIGGFMVMCRDGAKGGDFVLGIAIILLAVGTAH